MIAQFIDIVGAQVIKLTGRLYTDNKILWECQVQDQEACALQLPILLATLLKLLLLYQMEIKLAQGLILPDNIGKDQRIY